MNAVALLKTTLLESIPAARLIDDPLHTLAYGTDASFYRLIPQLVVQIENEAEIILLLQQAGKLGIAVTFRAAGTSLSGQAVSDSVLAVLAGNHWDKREVLNNGEEICLQPGVIGAMANESLKPFQKKIGPDPASIASAKIGGIAANNASGMCCGTAQNSYNTLTGMRIVFADGSILDTRNEQSITDFHQNHPAIINGLQQLHDQVKSDATLLNLIKHKYRLKNTTGYGLNALIDFEDPIEILQHLMIGSEGTLGFISEINYSTVHDHPAKSTALVLFDTIESACKAVHQLQSQPVDAVELMDRSALSAVENKSGMPASLKSLPSQAAALLIDIREHDDQTLQQSIHQVLQVLEQFSVLEQPAFTHDAAHYQSLWNIRKGLFPAVGSVRETGTTVIIEDVAFPLESLAEGTLQLQALFSKYHYSEAIIFGHALAGNLHFVFTQDFSTEAEVTRYADFMHDVSELVAVKYGGSLKAEHGTGRNMAPFVELEWGEDAYGVMQTLKNLFDPNNLLNPGVILNSDKNAHITNLKPMPAAHELVDKCIECGFCESICPSRNLTLTPRQRIVTLREMARLERNQDTEALKSFKDHFQYEALDTCAVDGLCATQCPVGINTGSLVKDLRTNQVGSTTSKTASWIDNHMAGVTAAGRNGLKAVRFIQNIAGDNLLEQSSRGISKLSGKRIPAWNRHMPGPASKLPVFNSEGKNGKVVYFPSCISRTMGTTKSASDQRELFTVMDSLLFKAGYSAVMPETVDKYCCGMPYASKGIEETAKTAVENLEEALWNASLQGELPIVCDTSPCTLRMIEEFTRPLKIYEPAGFIHEHLLPHLTLTRPVDEVALHVTCSSRKMGLDEVMQTLTAACAKTVITPEEKGCCGFAGDRGFTHPELNAAALSQLRQQIPAECKSGVSNSLTCEIGLSKHSGIEYRSIAYLVDECFSAEDSQSSLHKS